MLLRADTKLFGFCLEEARALALHNKATFDQIHGMVNGYLERCARRYIDMKSLFGFMEKLQV
jgi:hypothetical protein